MKRLFLLLLGLGLLLPALPAETQEFGRVRGLEKRAETVARQKNRFVSLVLKSYNIPHQINDQEVVTRIQVEDQWHEVTTIEIVPLLQEENDAVRQVTAHELFFFTPGGVLNFVSALTIR